MTEDPQARFRTLPTPTDPKDWVTEVPVEPVPGSVQAAEDDAPLRDARYLIERAGGF